MPITRGLDDLLRLRGVTYEWIDPETHANQTGTQRGFIAQDVEKVFPGWVNTDKDGFKTLSVSQIEALEVESIRTLKMQNDMLAERVRDLESGVRPRVSGID
ncbi:MAG: tail fiber domain-containing protein, partial [Rhodomicrobium sp.]